MKKMSGKICAAALVWGALAVCAHAQQEAAPRPDAELPNFQRVNENLYRGAQPAPGGFQKLSALGVKTVVNLRGADANSLAEEREARAAGLQYFNVPLPSYAKPRDEQVERVLAVIGAPENWPVFVHCKRGSDRTGIVVAAYRISRDGWTSEQAKREAAHYGLSRAQFEMRDYITDYYRKRVGQDLDTDIPAAASAATRRTLSKSYSITRDGLHRLKKALD